ncbi:DUF6311 domain-containing protein [Pseudomonas sp. Pseusp97]|uniref:DUF6311 domain-containing protein n=1 Tax=Pseudomonas sp. Pseusp97 TaxID=3243065 RepID=UPI0039A65C7A
MSQFQKLVASATFSTTSRLWKDSPSGPTYLAALLLAMALVLHLYPLSFLAGHGLYFEGGDAASHVAGWLFFEKDDWHFPLLKSVRLNAPEGTSIAFTDSIPLLALLLKPFRSLLPDGFHYFGLWHAFSYLLQAAAAVFVIRSLEVRHLPGALLAAAFAITWPVLTHRMGHTALMTQALLLLALGAYFRGHHAAWTVRSTGLGLITLSCIALLVHPYLLAMVYPLFIASLLSLHRQSRLTLRQGLGWVVASLIALLGILYAGGYFIGKGAAAGGYGVYSLNLLSPFCGGLFCAPVDATGGQDEGFNYLGAGVLLLLPLALMLHGPQLPSSARRHAPLLLILLGFGLYAASNRLFLGQRLLLDLHLPQWLESAFGIFRVSGRFFWLVGYGVLFAVLAVLLRRKSNVLLVITLAALLLQWHDTRPLRERVQFLSQLPATLDLQPWRKALAGLHAIEIYPAYGCGDTPTEDYVRYQYIAANLGMTINSAYTARIATQCEQKNAFSQRPAEDGQLYVRAGFLRNSLSLPPLFQESISAGKCSVDTIHLICAKGRTSTVWETLGTPLTPGQSEFSAHWSAAQLPSLIGHLQGDRLVPREAGVVGYLSYGPYIELAAGIYQHRLDYASQADSDTIVGTWDLIGQGPSGSIVTLASGPLLGTQGAGRTLTGKVALSDPMQRVELRLLSNGGDLQLKAISISADQPAVKSAAR